MTSLQARLPTLRARVDAATIHYLDMLCGTISPTQSAADLLAAARAQVSAGKRFRGILALLGAEIADPDAKAPVALAAALEMYQASALAHDDLIDHAPQRRGQVTPHVYFARAHEASGWCGSATDHGVAGAVLLGDLLLSLAEASIGLDCARLDSDRAARVRSRFSTMHAQVALGQYLDVMAEHQPLDAGDDHAVTVEAALDVVVRKSANYSVVQPMLLGAQYAGAPQAVLDALEQVLLPWGIAFQLRDDDLGIFGDTSQTGKPAGDDLVEGKRTALLALTWKNATESERHALMAVLGNPAADATQVQAVATIVSKRGRPAHEELIADYIQAGHDALVQAPVSDQARQLLGEIAQLLTNRSA